MRFCAFLCASRVGLCVVLSFCLGDIFVSDNKNHCIHKFRATGQYLLAIGSHGNGIGQFNSPRVLALDRLRRLVVADSYNHRIQVRVYVAKTDPLNTNSITV